MSTGANGWQDAEPRGDDEVQVQWKQSADGLYVEVVIARAEAGFVVKDLAESRTAGPNATVSRPFLTIHEAEEGAARIRTEWDHELDG